MLWNTPTSAALLPASITTITRFITTPFSTQLDHLFPFVHHLLYATILESTMAYQALCALSYFSTNNTLTQLIVLFQIYSTLCILFTRATWCLAGAPNPFWTAATQEFPTILAFEQCLLEAQELTLDLLYVEGVTISTFLTFLSMDLALFLQCILSYCDMQFILSQGMLISLSIFSWDLQSPLC